LFYCPPTVYTRGPQWSPFLPPFSFLFSLLLILFCLLGILWNRLRPQGRRQLVSAFTSRPPTPQHPPARPPSALSSLFFFFVVSSSLFPASGLPLIDRTKYLPLGLKRFTVPSAKMQKKASPHPTRFLFLDSHVTRFSTLHRSVFFSQFKDLPFLITLALNLWSPVCWEPVQLILAKCIFSFYPPHSFSAYPEV